MKKVCGAEATSEEISFVYATVFLFLFVFVFVIFCEDENWGSGYPGWCGHVGRFTATNLPAPGPRALLLLLLLLDGGRHGLTVPSGHLGTLPSSLGPKSALLWRSSWCHLVILNPQWPSKIKVSSKSPWSVFLPMLGFVVFCNFVSRISTKVSSVSTLVANWKLLS